MSLENQNNKRIARNTIFLYLRVLVTMVITLYTTRVVLNVLGVVDFGVYNVVCGFVSLFSFMNTTMSNGIQRFYNFEAGKNGIESVTKVYQTAFQIQLLLVFSVFLFVEPFGIWYINNKMVIPTERIFAANWVFQCSLFSLVFLIMQVPFSASVMAHERMNYYASVGILDAFLKLAIVLFLPYISGDSLIIYGILILLVSVLDLLLFSVYALKNFPELKLKMIFHKELFKSIFNFTSWNLIEMFAWTTQGHGVNMVMNLFCGPVVNAAQGIASQISSALNAFCTNLSVAFRPQLVRSYAESDIERTTMMMFAMSKSMFFIMTVMIIPLSFEMEYVLYLWLGSCIPDYTIQFAVLLLFTMLPRNMTMAISQVIHATGKMRNYQLGNTIVVLSILPISFVLLRSNYSPVFVYVVSFFVFIFLWGLDVLMLKNVFPFPIGKYVKSVVFPCLLTFVLSLLIPVSLVYLLDEGIIRLVLIVVTNLIFCGLIAYFTLLDGKEKDFFSSFFKKRIN